MRQLVWSSDVYCQIAINFQHGQMSYLYQNGKKGKRASCRRAESENALETASGWKVAVALVVKTTVGEMDHFGIILGFEVRIIYSKETILMGKERLQR